MISQEEGEGEEGLWTPARPNRWPGLFSSVYARILSSFCSISAPSSNDPFFFFLPFQRTEKSLLIPSWKTNPLSLLPGVLLRHLLNFFWSKGHSIFSFFLLKFSFLFLFGGERREDIRERREVFILFVVMR